LITIPCPLFEKHPQEINKSNAAPFFIGAQNSFLGVFIVSYWCIAWLKSLFETIEQWAIDHVKLRKKHRGV
jgi:hypothetical protein